MTAKANPEQDAYQAIAIASYKQSGLEQAVQKQIERKVPDDVKKVTGNIFFIVKTLKDQKISYTWSF